MFSVGADKCLAVIREAGMNRNLTCEGMATFKDAVWRLHGNDSF